MSDQQYYKDPNLEITIFQKITHTFLPNGLQRSICSLQSRILTRQLLPTDDVVVLEEPAALLSQVDRGSFRIWNEQEPMSDVVALRSVEEEVCQEESWQGVPLLSFLRLPLLLQEIS